MRRVPREPATDFEVGDIQTGLDGDQYIVFMVNKGTKYWFKYEKKPKGKQYYTHDNEERPYLVIIQSKKKNVYIYSRPKNYDYSNNDSDYTYSDYSYLCLVQHYKVKKIYVGKSTPNIDYDKSYGDGNTILLQLTNTKYVYIGGTMIYEFYSDDQVQKYFSHLGVSDTPEPVLLGKENVYFLEKKKYIPRDIFPTDVDWETAYDLFRKLKKHSKGYRVKTISKTC